MGTKTELAYNVVRLVFSLNYLNNKHKKSLTQTELVDIVKADPEHWLYVISEYGISVYLDEAYRKGYVKLVDREGTDEVGYKVIISSGKLEKLLDSF